MLDEIRHLREARNLVTAILHWPEAVPGQPCLRFHRDGAWRDLSWAELGERVTRIAGGLLALGVRPGDRVGLVSTNRPEWALADIGALAAGAVVVPVYATLPPADTGFPLAHAGCRVVLVEDAEQAAKLARAEVDGVERVVVLDDSPVAGTMAFAELAAATAPAELPGTATGRDDLLTILYTSGTTGVPKGVQLTHDNVLAVLAMALEMFEQELPRVRRNLSFLPLAHALERIGGHFLPLTLGRTIVYARALETIGDDLRTAQPHVVMAVPRVYEKIHGRIMARVAEAPPLRRALFDWSLAVGTRVSRRLEAGRPLPTLLRLQRVVADRLVFRKLRAAVGGEVVLMVSGGAPLEADVARFFHAVGLLVCEGWGATETAAPATFNTPRAFRFGAVGRPLPGVEVRVADDGELLIRGANVFTGYWQRPELNAEAFDGDGFWRTGDVGRVDDEGFVWITDRKKEILVTAGGKNIAPQKIEAMLRQRPLISQACLVGDRRPYVTAVLTVDREALAVAHPQLAGAAAGDPRLHELLAPEVAAVNAGLARFESVRRFAVVEPDFSVAGGELTVTLKLKRRVVLELHAAAVDDLYR